MPEQCRSNGGVRHHRTCRSDGAEPLPGRLFLCARCRAQVLICGCCDRGQIYCAGDCARQARHGAQRAAGRRYQLSWRGRLAHAERARRYRARQKNVTHQGSPLPLSNDLLALASAATMSDAVVSGDTSRPAWHCHWCGCRCPPFVRQGFLRRRGPRRGVVRHDR
jgi:hypothetical protein